MPGMLIFAFLAIVIILRATRSPGAGLAGGIVLMGFGIWLVWNGAVHGLALFGPVYDPPRFGTLFLGLWLIVKGALRASSSY